MFSQSEQLAFPLEVRPTQEVRYWAQPMIERTRFFGRAVVKEVAEDQPLRAIKIDVEKINEFEDPNLRYALRFAAVAQSMGSIPDNEFTSHGQCVLIDATDEGVKSQLLTQWYSGQGLVDRDTLMEDIHSFAPLTDENY